MKKIFLFFSLFVLLSFTVFARSFPDLPEDHANFSAIEYLRANDILHGYDDSTFKPDKLVNRAEAVKIISGAFDIAPDSDSDIIFADVPSGEWFFGFVMGAHKNGIIQGYENGKFMPANTVNLAETLKILHLAAGVETEDEPEFDVFLDVPKDEWYAPYAQYAREHNIILADDYGKISANKDMTRAEIAEVIYRMKIVKENDGQEFPLSKDWSYYEGKNIPFKMKYNPKDWKYIETPTEVVFYKPDKVYSQFSAFRSYPNSAKVIVALDNNEMSLSASQYFNNLRSAFNGAEFTEFTLKNLPAIEIRFPDLRQVDWYLYLENGNVLGVYTEYGSGPQGFQLTRFIKSMLNTLEYMEIDETYYEAKDKILSDIFQNILIKNQGLKLLETLPDQIIIETDTIGVGTGPVDYYYSEKINHTFKYERADDLILDTREGRTSAF